MYFLLAVNDAAITAPAIAEEPIMPRWQPPRPSPVSQGPRPVSAPQVAHAPLSSSPRPYSEYPSNDDDTGIRIVAEGEIDPVHLIPAQTNAGDSLSPPTATTLNADHVPFIPAPPLLTTHRALQSKLDDLESALKDYRSHKQQHRLQGMSENELDAVILQFTAQTAEVKQTLNRVRTLYMNAATIPTVLQFQTHLIAYQITLIESSIFCAIPPTALLEHSAKHPHPRIVASTDFFNYITRVIEHGILLPQEASTRAQHINHWIKVASKCLDLNNYQTLKAIVSALGTPPVQRLRRTWAYIPKKSLTRLETLNELMSENDNYGKYREHMGLLNTSVINGKSVSSIRAEHYSRPTVPFLGTFIHDMTYLVAAVKDQPPTNDPRVSDVLHIMEKFQKGPRYSPGPPAWFVKSSHKHHIRPAISSALHRSASGIGRFSGGMFGFSNNDDSESLREGFDDEGSMEEQQQMATQYILMRSWVNQNTVDELSMLREPPRQNKANPMGNHRSTSGSNYHTSSVMSNTSSMMRFSAGSVSLSTLSSNTAGNPDSRPTSMDEYSPDLTTSRSSSSDDHFADQKSGGSSFWPFRRSIDRQSMDEPKNSNLDVVLTDANGHEEAPPRPSPRRQVPAAPHIPPRPPRTTTQSNNDESKSQSEHQFKNALSERLQAQVAARHS